MVEKILKRIYMMLIFIFMYAPIVVLVVFSFNNSKSRSSWDGFTLKWYIELFKDRQIMKSLYYTVTIAVMASVISTVTGTIAAIGIYDMKKLPKKLLLNINYLPVLNPDIVTGVALMTLYIFAGMRLGFMTMLLSHITFDIPYVILAVLPKLRQLPKNTLEAAMDLGATPFYALRKVILPQIKPGIVSGLLIAFTMSIDDFVISFFTTGSGVTNLSITIYSMARRGINPKINALSTLMFATVLMLLLILNKKSPKELIGKGSDELY
ncbi:spermidine/putrescine transport system permease protein [Peptoclostridium litorale DSM 5388]|uniref:Spermidine/putrescine transport system permease protein PotC n=1 Tax=Peptoclostridium litorale DSM 5388 TaxID=1121324 RepID=A0A069RPZ9_PEPLI|nr:ABC transporter permease [Peptoclostridium litorale]KDR96257.1 spermidine/putrescine transport system permease protein PotC [Peptoclostridium litorale DSM 5388]SIO14613.1 spermidine/putrescine transport system permease protein [Peptoclostridium litorale DSM 5388]